MTTVPRGLTYTRESRHSYFRDRVMASRHRDRDAEERLRQHAREMEVLAQERSKRSVVTTLETGESVTYEYEQRTNPSTTQGQGGYFDAPIWLNEYFATAPRPGLVLADLAPNFPLPENVVSVNVPIITTGVLAQSSPDLAPAPNQDIADSAQTAKVVEIAGIADVSLQLLEQSPAGAHLDFVIYKDGTEAYNQSLETQLINGLGNNSTQILGILNVANIKTTTYTDASPTVAAMYPKLGQVAAAIGNNRKLPPEAWLMTSSRWSWIGSSVDTSNRPIAPPWVVSGNDGYTVPPVGGLLSQSWPAYVTDAMPTTLGAGSNQDRIVALRPSDLLVFEAGARKVVLEEPLSASLGARILFRNYCAAFTARYPSGISVLQGTGTIVQSGF